MNGLTIRELVTTHQLGVVFQQAIIGIEKEGQRVTQDGELAQTLHPRAFGSRTFHPYIQTDFAESQLELITPPTPQLSETLRWLTAIHEVVLRNLPENEVIWPLSMPPHLPSDDAITIAQLETPADVAYRQHLAQTYGKKKQMVSGIHYNFELHPEMITALFAQQTAYTDRQAFQTAVYMKLARQFMRYQWLLVYLLGAATEVDASYFNGNSPFALGEAVRSIRSSQHGYVNDPSVQVSYDNLQAYVDTLTAQVASGALSEEKEYYATVRFRGAKTAAELLTKGIAYVELRLFDLNPYVLEGMSVADARFVHLFLLLMLWLDEAPEGAVMLGKTMMQQVALEHPTAASTYAAEGEWLLSEMRAMLDHIHGTATDYTLVDEKRAQVLDPQQTLGARIYRDSRAYGSYEAFGLHQAQAHRQQVMAKPYGLPAFSGMELSTQALMFDAIQYGITVDILDERDQMLALRYGGHTEYVKNGNMTAQDNYISHYLMANKVVTKKVLAQAGYRVPRSFEYTSVEAAVAEVSRFIGQAIVIKPKSTNFGLGITIFQEGLQDVQDFETAVTLAFAEDDEVMVETYLPGTEYRFFVLDGQTRAVLLRVPANVVGDGVQTVAALVAQKNNHPLRGDGSRTPLKKIALGAIEQLQLKEQGLTLDSVPAAGQVVQLRANSNISTGGDSIDMTDHVHPSYLTIAAGVAQAMTATVCGVDLIIPDISQPATAEDSYGVVEANFNPMMMMHIYPYEGQSRRLTQDVLQLLFPEYPWT